MPPPNARLLFLTTLVLPIGLLAAACSTPSSGSSNAEKPDSSSTEAATLPSTTPSPYPDRIVLSWEEDPASSLSVTWRTDSTVTDAKAQIAPALGAPSFYTKAKTVDAETQDLHTHKVTGEHVNAKYHSVTFDGLMADTLYAYRVGDGTHWSEWFHARTASRQPEPFSFVYVGDAQNNVRSHWSRLLRQAYADAPTIDFMIHAGDLVNNAHRNVEWGHWNAAGGWIQSMVPNVAVPGNHEYGGYRSWHARDTFRVEVEATGQKMTGTILEPDGNPEPLEASSSADPSADSYPAGGWDYNVDNGEYVGTLEIDGDSSGYSATLVNEDGDEFPLQNVAVDGSTLTGHFMMEVEKESPEKLSIHWHPQFTLPKNGPEGMEETVYSLDYQGMRIIALNSNIRDSSRLARQTQWLESTLRKTAQNDDIRWTVATFHHPMFSSGEGRSNAALRDRWTPLFDEYNVDLVMQGHDHTYARGRLENLEQGVNARSPKGGTVYVNSVSGAKMYEIKPDRWEDFDGIEMERGAENTQLYQVVRVQQDTLKFRSYTATGQPYDAFDLVQRQGAPNEMIERPPANTDERMHENTLDYMRP
ncbi:serine/threonine protein phosphatase [Salinibacter sp. 10B]|uniref:fibronectin type III domain-containing protein n=1 Tax=Salinibacter sp. 10B TaxID=1923971 RepID=UPI000CF3D150|nr:fibronectin type III domain-containing protein [Salinibacter sp. 10B]PQJ34909.1 serine/threonine protein phosphatase [Salinibacter sp. 10B]